MHRPALRVRSALLLGIVAALVVAGCGSGAPSAAVVSTPVPATPSPELATAEPPAGVIATIPDPCTLLPKAAIDALLGGTADQGTQSELRDDTGVQCDFEADNGASLEVIVETDYATLSDFIDEFDFATTAVPGLGEAAYYSYFDAGTPPTSTLWVYMNGLAIGLPLSKPGLTGASGLELLTTFAAEFLPGA